MIQNRAVETVPTDYETHLRGFLPEVPEGDFVFSVAANLFARIFPGSEVGNIFGELCDLRLESDPNPVNAEVLSEIDRIVRRK